MAKADRALVRRANHEVSVFDVLEEEFNIRHPREGGSYKGWCPFAFEHGDGGVEKQFRTYPATNTAYCFAMHGILTPTKLIEVKYDLTPTQAAMKLLDAKGLLKAKPVQERWAEVLSDRQREVHGSPQTLVEALHTYLSTHPVYADGSLTNEFMSAMEKELAVLDHVLADDRVNSTVIRAWYSKAKHELMEVLNNIYAKETV